MGPFDRYSNEILPMTVRTDPFAEELCVFPRVFLRKDDALKSKNVSAY